MDDFFTQYTLAFDSLDAKAIAHCYQLPCAISDGDGKHVYTDKSALIEKFSQNCQSMKAMGYQNSTFNIIQQQALGEAAVAVTIGWRVQTHTSSLEFRALYVCHKTSDKWSIFSVNVYPGTFDL